MYGLYPDVEDYEPWWDPMSINVLLTTSDTAPRCGKKQEAALQRRTRRTGHYWYLSALNTSGPERKKPEGWEDSDLITKQLDLFAVCSTLGRRVLL